MHYFKESSEVDKLLSRERSKTNDRTEKKDGNGVDSEGLQ